MQSRFTAKGLNSEDKPVILAYQLKEEEFKVLTDAPSAYTFSKTIQANLYQVSKIDSSNTYSVPMYYEFQIFKPSFSNRSILDITFNHGADEVYVAFSPISSYRTHTEQY